MINKVVIEGRAVKDPVVTQSGDCCVARITLACQRDYKNSKGEYDTDFVSCVAFKGGSNYLEKYVKKGDRITVEGRLQTGSYQNKEGQTVYTTDVVIEKTSIQKSFSNNGQGGQQMAQVPQQAYVQQAVQPQMAQVPQQAYVQPQPQVQPQMAPNIIPTSPEDLFGGGNFQ